MSKKLIVLNPTQSFLQVTYEVYGKAEVGTGKLMPGCDRGVHQLGCRISRLQRHLDALEKRMIGKLCGIEPESVQTFFAFLALFG